VFFVVHARDGREARLFLSRFRLTSYNLDAGCVTCGDHGLVLRSVTAFGREDVRDGLIIRPPLETLDMFLRRAH
jgi:hypothetical protein